MNFAQLRAFHAVATHGTFSSAAGALGISQPAVTQHIRALEESLGARLFHRRGGGAELTADACELLPKVREVVLSLQDIDGRIDKGRGLITGNLSVGLCAPHVAMPVIRHFHAAHPGIRFDIRLENSARLIELVDQYRIDIAVATLTAPRADFVCERLTMQEVLILVPAEHPWRSRRSVRISALEGATFVLREPGSMTQFLFERALAAAGVEIGDRLVVGSREAVKEAVAAGLGLGIVLDKELGSDPRLIGLRLADAEASAHEYLVAQPALAELGAVRSFFAAARACYAGESRSDAGRRNGG